jgi:hypothetical protein
MTHKYSVKEDFFSIPNLLNCYWAGFLAADGCKPKKFSVTLALSVKDLTHLERFKFDIGSTYPIKFYSASCFTYVNRRQIYENLETIFNIVPRKSLIYTYPNLTEKHLVDAFIIGYIDGDGSIFFQKGRKKAIVLSICGTLACLSWVRQRFSEILNIGNWGHLGKSKNIYHLCSSGKYAVSLLDFYRETYPDLPFLERKWSRLKQARHKFRVYDIWSREDEEILIRLHPIQTCKEIWEANFSNRNYSSVEKKMQMLGLKKHFEKKWTVEEDALLAQNYGKKTCKEIYDLFFLGSRSFSSVKNRIRVKRLKKCR